MQVIITNKRSLNEMVVKLNIHVLSDEQLTV